MKASVFYRVTAVILVLFAWRKKSGVQPPHSKGERVEARPVAPGGAGDEGFCWLLNVGAEAPTP